MAKAIWILACKLAAGDPKETGVARRALYRAQRGECWWCNQPFKADPSKPPFPPEKAAKARIVLNIPLVENGKWWPSNLRLVCPGCADAKEERDRARQPKMPPSANLW
jgi:5-methylcytosine-specific restriction endonuclease McrA